MPVCTEGFVRAVVMADTPLPVIDALHCMVGNIQEKDVDWNSPELQVAFLLEEGSRGRSLWNFVVRHSDQPSVFVRDGNRGHWHLHALTSVKNYNHELEQFFNWIRPYLREKAGEFIGYAVHDQHPGSVKVFFAAGKTRGFSYARSDI